MERLRRNRKVGDIRVARLYKEYKDEGFHVIVNYGSNHGADLVLITKPNGRVVKAIEVTNYKEACYISAATFLRYKTTLNEFDDIGAEKELVISHERNLDSYQRKECQENNIHVLVVGGQELISGSKFLS